MNITLEELEKRLEAYKGSDRSVLGATDSDFMQTAREAIPWLISEVRKTRAANETLERQIEALEAELKQARGAVSRLQSLNTELSQELEQWVKTVPDPMAGIKRQPSPTEESQP